MNKELKVAGMAVLVLAVLFGVLSWLNHYNYQRGLIKEKDQNLTEENRKIYEDRLIQVDEELAKPELTDTQRYDLLVYKGYQVYGLGKLEESTGYFIDAINILPDVVNAYVALYTVQMEMLDHRGASKSIKKAIELKPDTADIWKKYIILEKERLNADNEKLNTLYTQALEKTSRNIDIVTVYASFLESVGDYQGSKIQWQDAIQIYPNNKAVYEAEIARLDQKIQAQ